MCIYLHYFVLVLLNTSRQDNAYFSLRKDKLKLVDLPGSGYELFLCSKKNCNKQGRLLQKKSPLTQLKIPYSLKKNAVESGLWAEVRFYYKLKKLSVHGSFPIKKAASIISEKTKMSKKAVYTNLKKLQNVGFIRNTGNELALVSYDTLWDHFDVEEEDRIPLFRIKSSDKLDSLIHYYEIKRAITKQSYEIQKQFVLHELGIDTDTEKNPSKKIKGFLKKTFTKKKLKELQEKQTQLIRSNLSSHVEMNWEETITCQTTAEIMGYTSPMQGYLIQRQLKAEGLLKIKSRKKRPLLIRENFSKKELELLDLDKSFYVNPKNRLVKALPNLITCVDI